MTKWEDIVISRYAISPWAPRTLPSAVAFASRVYSVSQALNKWPHANTALDYRQSQFENRIHAGRVCYRGLAQPLITTRRF